MKTTPRSMLVVDDDKDTCLNLVDRMEVHERRVADRLKKVRAIRFDQCLETELELCVH